MTWLLVFLLAIGILIFSVKKGIAMTKKRRQAEKDKVWNDQLESLLQSLKKT